MMGRSTGMGPGLLVLLLLNIGLFLLDHVAHVPCQWLYLQVTPVAGGGCTQPTIATQTRPGHFCSQHLLRKKQLLGEHWLPCKHIDQDCLHFRYNRQHQQQPTEDQCLTSISTRQSTPLCMRTTTCALVPPSQVCMLLLLASTRLSVYDCSSGGPSGTSLSPRPSSTSAFHTSATTSSSSTSLAGLVSLV